MNCPGSVGLLKELKLPLTDEPEYRSLGTTAHMAAQKCLTEKLDAWEVMGEQFGKHKVDQEMATAIQQYLDECNGIMAEHPGGEERIEVMIDAPDFHEAFYGTCDWSYRLPETLFIRDFKYGQGIFVEVKGNPQIRYYAYGVLRPFADIIQNVDLGIVQPRVPYGEAVRKETLTAAEIVEWAETELKPAMERTALDTDLVAGPHCRFCPAKLVCPLMTSLFGAAMQADPKQLVKFSSESIDRSYPFIQAVKFYIKAMEEEAFRRLNAGEPFKVIKLVQKKADRVFKPGADQELRAQLGPVAFTEPALKSPAQMEKISQQAKKLVSEWAYTPMTGLTVALVTDKRQEIKTQTMQEKFGAAAAALVQKQNEELEV
jgi:hypothetical protein